MAIYTRNKKGNLVPLKIRAIKGEDGITPNIQIGEVTTLEPNQQATVENVGTLENPVFNFGIPKGADGTGGGSGVKINDNNISKDEVWSSAKTEDFVLTNTDTVWTEVSGENLSIDYTKEGYLREVEIWGNTIQNEEDLSDIQHLGELYLDDEGEPILDDLGREQYKIEIESSNKNLAPTNFKLGSLVSTTGNFTSSTNAIASEDYIKAIEGQTLSIQCEEAGRIRNCNYDKDKNFLKYQQANAVKKIQRTIETGTKYLRVHFEGTTDTKQKIQIEYGSSYTDYVEPVSNKTTILLPCQLMKVGDVKDRLYWDSEKGKYIVEKNVKLKDYKITIYNSNTTYTEHSNYFIFKKPTDAYDFGVNNGNTYVECDFATTVGKVLVNTERTSEYSIATYGVNDYCIMTPKTISSTQQVNELIASNNWKIKYLVKQTPQLIETNITEPIKLPTYIDKTHIFVSGNVDGSIKAKAPLDGGQAILSLSQENKELKSVNQEQDELINISLLATDEMLTILEPLITNAISLNSKSENHIVNMYVVMVNRKLKNIEQVPSVYKEQVKEILGL